MSEFSLIYRHFQHLTQSHTQTVLGIGDDCAISRIVPDCELVSCVDMLVAGRHFPQDTPAYAIGFKSVAVNLSDLASMGATPYAILLAVSLPSNDEKWLKEFTQGIGDICQKFNVELIGGDTTKSELLTISVTALGFVKTGQAIRRDGAKVGDVVCVGGHIGSASLALSQMLCGQQSKLRQALDLPMPQVALGQQLLGYATSMIDVSDGLGQDLGHILKASGVRAKLYLENIPCADELKPLPFNEKYQHILNGGDDYKLCFTMPKDKFDEFNQNHPNSIFAIGKICQGQGLDLFFKNQAVDFKVAGWQHF